MVYKDICNFLNSCRETMVTSKSHKPLPVSLFLKQQISLCCIMPGSFFFLHSSVNTVWVDISFVVWLFSLIKKSYFRKKTKQKVKSKKKRQKTNRQKPKERKKNKKKKRNQNKTKKQRKSKTKAENKKQRPTKLMLGSDPNILVHYMCMKWGQMFT